MQSNNESYLLKIERSFIIMNIIAIYKKHLSLNKNNKNLALGKALKEITDIISKSNVDEKFIKEYYNAKRHSVILNIISPGLIFGLSTGAIISVIDLNIQITNIFSLLLYFIYVLFSLIVGSTIFYFIPTLIYGTRVKSVLLPHKIRRMELRIDDYYKNLHNKNQNNVIRIKFKRKNPSLH